jgi:hypothetical protein
MKVEVLLQVRIETLMYEVHEVNNLFSLIDDISTGFGDMG